MQISKSTPIQDKMNKGRGNLQTCSYFHKKSETLASIAEKPLYPPLSYGE